MQGRVQQTDRHRQTVHNPAVSTGVSQKQLVLFMLVGLIPVPKICTKVYPIGVA